MNDTRVGSRLLHTAAATESLAAAAAKMCDLSIDAAPLPARIFGTDGGAL